VVESRSPAQIAGDVLRDLREQAELTQSELARKVFCSQSLISALENAKKTAHSDLIRLIDEAVVARGALIKIWPVTASGEQSIESLADLEAAATQIHDWDERAIPGLLETPGYARAIIRAANPRASEQTVAELVDKRIARQEVLTRASPPLTWFVFDESALYRPFGGTAAMRTQLLHLAGIARQPDVFVQVMRYTSVNHPGSCGPLRIMEFSDKPPIWYTEGWSSGRMTDAPDEVAEQAMNFSLIRAAALPLDESIRFIEEIRRSHYE
jgi:transcriptional regulator with XRE-family HTH domain